MKPSTSVRIAIDAQNLVSEPNTSGGVYLGEMLRDWVAVGAAAQFDLFVPFQPEKDCPFADLFATPNIRLIAPERPVQPRSAYRRQLGWQQVIIPNLIRKVRPAVYFSPFHLTPMLPLRARMVTTIHDLCFLSEPVMSLSHWIHRLQVLSAGARARALICVSAFTQAALSEWWPRAARKAVIIPNGVSAETMPLEEAEATLRAERLEIAPQRYFLWIGNPLQARKNVGLLLAAFAAHKKAYPEHRYVMVVPERAREVLLARPEVARLRPALTLISGVNHRVRDALYRCALALVFPSTCEGFGYPVLEAMAQGCPPIAAREGPAAEIAGDIMTLCPDFRVESFAGRMRAVFELTGDERAALGAALSQRARGFSVRRMAGSTLEVLLRVAAD